MAKNVIKTTNGKTDPKASKATTVDKFDYDLSPLIDEGIALQAQSAKQRFVGFVKLSLGSLQSVQTLEQSAGLQAAEARLIVAKAVFSKTVAAIPEARDAFNAAGKPTFRKWKTTDSAPCRSFLQAWQKRTSIIVACGKLVQQLQLLKVDVASAADSGYTESKLYEVFKAWTRKIKAKKLSLRNKSELDACRSILIQLWNQCLTLTSAKIAAIDATVPKKVKDTGETPDEGVPDGKGTAKLSTFPSMVAMCEAADAGRYTADECRLGIRSLTAALAIAIKAKGKKTPKVVEVVEEDDEE